MNRMTKTIWGPSRRSSPPQRAPVTRQLRAMDQRVVTLKAVLRDVLDNRGCSCGGWKCARCKLALREARLALTSVMPPRKGR